MNSAIWTLGILGGWLLWPLLEYVIHGVMSHRLRTFASPLHWQHHEDPRAVFTSPLVWVPGSVALWGLLALVLGLALATPIVLGTLGGFLRYEFVHWRIHFRPARTAGQRRLRGHHLAHHYCDPSAYHGVTTRFWDRAFGTLPDNHEAAAARVVDRAPLVGRSNLGRLLPNRSVRAASRRGV